MKITKKLILLILIFSTVFASQFIIPENISKVKASQNLWSQQVGLGASGDTPIADAFGGGAPKDPRLIIAYIIKIFLGFLGLIFLILIIMAGYTWMTAGGNEEKITKAKDTLQTAIIGLIIIMAAYAIADYITSCVLDVTSGTRTMWMCR